MYCRDNAGLVHVVTPANEEYTICGNAWDGDAEGMYGDNSDDPHAWERVPRGPVTCPKCAAIVIVAKRARVSKSVQAARLNEARAAIKKASEPE